MRNLKELIRYAVSDAIDMDALSDAIHDRCIIDYDALADAVLDLVDTDEIAVDIVADWL